MAGTLEVHVEDSVAGSRVHYDLVANGRRRRLQFTGAGPQLQSGSRVRVRGVPKGDALVVESNANGLVVEAAALADTSNVQRTAVILVNFTDKALQPYTTEFARQVVFDATSNWDLENSHGQTSLEGNVFGWFTIPMASTTCDTTKIASLGKTAATNAGISLSGYTRFVFAFPSTSACTWWGWGQIGGSPTNAWVNGSFALRVVAHEMGHNLGLYHAQSLDCGAAPIGTSCTSDPYGDVLDTMGGTSINHFNAFQKERLGWIGATGQPPVVTVTQSGTYWLDPYETDGGTAKALKIRKSGSNGSRTFYYVEMRRGLGADSAMRTSANLMNGVVIHTGTENNANSSFLLDMTPETTSFADAALAVGRSFGDASARVTITPLSVSDTGGYVSVTFDVPAVPALATTLSADKAIYLTNQTATLTARVTADGSAAPGASVTLTVTLPSGQKRTLTGVTDAMGGARFPVKIAKRNPKGTWQAGVLASAAGASAAATMTFIVQ